MGCGKSSVAVPPGQDAAPKGGLARRGAGPSASPSPIGSESQGQVAKAPDESSLEKPSLAGHGVDIGDIHVDTSLRGKGEAAVPSKDAIAEASAFVQEVLSSTRAYLEIGDAIGSETVFVGALRRLEARSLTAAATPLAVSAIRSSPEYASTLELLRTLERVVQEVLGEDTGDGEWISGTEVKVDHAVLGLPVDEETAKILFPHGHSVQTMYRQVGKRLDVKVSGLLPTRTPSGLPVLTGLVAMYQETDLWHTWNPVVQGKGPHELQPSGPRRNLLHVLSKVLLRKYCELVEAQVFFVRDVGVHVMSMSGKSAGHDLWKKHPPPAGYEPIPGETRTAVVSITQKLTTLFSVYITIFADVTMPKVLLSLIVSWILPELIRRMLKAGAQCVRSDGPYQPRIEADVHGLYAECREVARCGAEIDEKTGRPPCQPIKMGPDAVLGRAGSLLTLEKAIARGEATWAIAGARKDTGPEVVVQNGQIEVQSEASACLLGEEPQNVEFASERPLQGNAKEAMLLEGSHEVNTCWCSCVQPPFALQ